MALLACLAAVAALSACGSGADDTGSSGSGSSADTAAAVEKAERMVEELSDISAVEFPTPPDSFDPGRHKIAILVAGNAGGSKTMGDYGVAAAEAIGWEYAFFDGKYTAEGQASALNQILVNDFDAVVMNAIDPLAVKSQISALIKKGVPIVCQECASVGEPPFPEIIQVGDDGRGGDLMQWFIIAETEGKANVAVFNDTAFPIVQVRVNSLIDGLKENCPECTTTTVTTPTSDVGKPGPPAWSAALQSDPDINWGAAPYDSIAPAMALTAQQLGRDAGVIGYDGTKEIIDEISGGDTLLKATLGAPYEYASWAAVDIAARAVVGATMWKADDLPTRLVTQDNADLFASGTWAPPGFDVQATFEKSWSQ